MKVRERNGIKMPEKELIEKEMLEKENTVNAIAEKEQNVSGESAENRLREAAVQIVPDEAAAARIIEGVKAGRRGRRRLTPRIPAASLAACLLLSLLFLARPGIIGEDVVVYAATEEHGWQRLKEGERIQLKMEPYDVLEDDDEAFDENGEYVSTYWPYKCTFRVEVAERYVYDRQMVILKYDDIIEYGDRIEWRVGPERPEDAGRVMQNSFRLWIVDENLERQAALELELTKEDGKCYAELKRVWESDAYQKRRHKK